MRGANENMCTTVLTEVRTTVKKKINFPDVATLVLLLWHHLLFYVYKCSQKLHKKMPAYRFETAALLINISLCEKK